jgi:hypothetical protein
MPPSLDSNAITPTSDQGRSKATHPSDIRQASVRHTPGMRRVSHVAPSSLRLRLSLRLLWCRHPFKLAPSASRTAAILASLRLSLSLALSLLPLHRYNMHVCVFICTHTHRQEEEGRLRVSYARAHTHTHTNTQTHTHKHVNTFGHQTATRPLAAASAEQSSSTIACITLRRLRPKYWLNSHTHKHACACIHAHTMIARWRKIRGT